MNLIGNAREYQAPAPESPLADIVENLLAADMVQFQQEVECALEPQTPYMTDVERSMFASGKKIRPVVMLLAARLVGGDGPLPDKVYKGAASLEMLHVATLIHDDIIDEAPLRRGLPSVAAERGTKTALLVGDLHFVQALRGFADSVETERDMTLVRMVLDTAFDICRGELDRSLPDTSVERLARYYQTIDRKTAVLFRLACHAGIELAGGRTRDARRGGFFGRALGRAFQIMDDILDLLEDENSAGKQAGTDLALGRLSLPLAYGMDSLGPGHPVSQALRGEATLMGHALATALDDLRECGAIDRAYAEARREMLEALFYLQPFAPSRYRDALEALTLFVVDRSLKN